MGLKRRLDLYKELEAIRKRPLVVFMTSTRPGVTAMIAQDLVGEMASQLEALPRGDSLDLLVVSHGGDPTVAWRVVSLIREHVKDLAVLVPQAAFSGATLIALGANEIVMHPNGNLGPTDPQITSRRRAKDGQAQQQVFGAQDLAAFLRFAKEEVGLTDQANLLEVLKQFCEQVGPVPIGVAARSSQLSESMGEKLLQLHMTDEAEKQKAHGISQALNRSFFHHGYPVSRREASEIGLKVAPSNPRVESVMWSIWLDLEEEFRIREPFNPVSLLRLDPRCQSLFEPFPVLNWPANAPPNVMHSVLSNMLPQMLLAVAPTRYELLAAILESPRRASRSITHGTIFATRQPDLEIKLQVVPDIQGWVDVNMVTGEVKRSVGPASAQATPTIQHAGQGKAPTPGPSGLHHAVAGGGSSAGPGPTPTAGSVDASITVGASVSAPEVPPATEGLPREGKQRRRRSGDARKKRLS